MKPSPAFQFYPADFLVGTADMSADEVGGYIRLLCYQWTKGPLPNNDKKLMQMSGVYAADELKVIKSKFSVQEDGTLVNLKMESVRQTQKEYSETQRAKAIKMWESKRDANASNRQEPGICPDDALQSSSSSLSSNTVKDTNVSSVDPPADKIDWVKLLNLFNEVFDRKSTVINDETKRSFRKRLKDGWTKESIYLAMQSVKNDRFHIESDYKHVTLAYFSRDKTLQMHGTKIERKQQSQSLTYFD